MQGRLLPQWQNQKAKGWYEWRPPFALGLCSIDYEKASPGLCRVDPPSHLLRSFRHTRRFWEGLLIAVLHCKEDRRRSLGSPSQSERGKEDTRRSSLGRSSHCSSAGALQGGYPAQLLRRPFHCISAGQSVARRIPSAALAHVSIASRLLPSCILFYSCLKQWAMERAFDVQKPKPCKMIGEHYLCQNTPASQKSSQNTQQSLSVHHVQHGHI